ncbi:hypothetical protein SAMN06295937_10182 [Sphingopyxis flava]|uniref:Uncharacterized protein n=1 Tax=Sphingopyxis flava TaxID=1507287 RepID=A0A1T5E0U4_9SPHN|nr:hypothetical protein SAMN06295937_10182 [Sphingopyxis flava]
MEPGRARRRVSSAGEGAQIGRERHYGTRRYRPDPGNRAEATHRIIDFHRCAQLEVQFFNFLCERRDLVQIQANDVTHHVRDIDGIVVHHANDSFEVCRPLGDDQPELG